MVKRLTESALGVQMVFSYCKLRLTKIRFHRFRDVVIAVTTVRLVKRNFQANDLKKLLLIYALLGGALCASTWCLKRFFKSFINSLKVLHERVGETVLIVKISVHDGREQLLCMVSCHGVHWLYKEWFQELKFWFNSTPSKVRTVQ